jgi:hypothetical protein
LTKLFVSTNCFLFTKYPPGELPPVGQTPSVVNITDARGELLCDDEI